jgi:hypothetical protein
MICFIHPCICDEGDGSPCIAGKYGPYGQTSSNDASCSYDFHRIKRSLELSTFYSCVLSIMSLGVQCDPGMFSANTGSNSCILLLLHFVLLILCPILLCLINTCYIKLSTRRFMPFWKIFNKFWLLCMYVFSTSHS